jgi:hypothetical protein
MEENELNLSQTQQLRAEVCLPSLMRQRRQMEEAASLIPPFSREELHALVGGQRLSQFQLRRRCDRYLLAFCLCLLALAGSILWHTATAGVTPWNVAVAILAVADLWVALRAARSLWLMRQTLRHRSRPYRMARYADRLNRLTRHRRWMGFVLRSSYNSVPVKDYRRIEFFSLRLPSYAIAASLLLFIAIDSDKAFAATRDYAKVTTTTGQSDTAIYDTVNKIIEQL